ncbi:MAG TPA: pyridoxal-dependent decarboxylase [Actinomycetota bacterium]
MRFPEAPVPPEEVFERLREFEVQSRFDEFDRNLFDEGPHLTSSSFLPFGDDVRHQVVEAYTRFIHGETWHTGAGAREMERQVISMMGGVLGNEDAVGFITSGGSESNLCALLAAKAGAGRAGRTASVVLPKHAHYSFFKGCRMFDLEPVVVEHVAGSPYRVDPDRVRDAVRDDTIAIIATAGTWPFGTIDPIEDFGAIAAERDLYLHVDGCFGGFILPFLERGGYPIDIPMWDFRVPAVSSVSADLHKNGMVPPPASSLYFRDESLLAHAKAIAPPFGTLAGTRGTGPIAASWTMLHLLGIERYVAIARRSMDLKRAIVDGVEGIDGLAVVPDGKINIFVVYSERFDLAPVVDALNEKGWMFVTNPVPEPVAICLCTMPQNETSAEPFLADLAEAMPAATPREGAPGGVAVRYGEASVAGAAYENVEGSAAVNTGEVGA